MRILIEIFNDEKRSEFVCYGEGGRIYTEKQRAYALYLIDEHGIRGTSRILEIPRRTLQRWCCKYGKQVKRCPDWVYERAERWRRRKKRYY